MNKFILVAALLGAVLAVEARADDFEACKQHLPYGTPTTAPDLTVTPICHAGYATAVDDVDLVPRWVAYHLTGPHTLGCLDRGNNFHPDEGLPAGHRARPVDYAKSGYDIGHQAPAQDFAWDAGEMSDSFSLANMAPQLPGLNRQGWERLEEAVRAWAWSRGDLQVYVGPVIGTTDAKIGVDQVDVPIAFWKVLVDRSTGEAVAFEMPQQDVAKGDLSPWQRSIADVERDASIRLPLPAGVDRVARPAIWAADLTGWRRAHAAACGS